MDVLKSIECLYFNFYVKEYIILSRFLELLFSYYDHLVSKAKTQTIFFNFASS